MTDTISVAMCTYNGAAYLPAQLESLAAQMRLPDELVVCDDDSSDQTVDLLKMFASSAPFPVRLYTNDSNLGPTKNFEKAIRLCTGDVIALCDQDDVWLSQKLARTESELEHARDAGVVFSDAELIDETGRYLGKRLWQELSADDDERVPAGRDKTWFELLPGATVTGATMAFRARYKNLVLPIPPNPQLIHDGWIALVVSCVARVMPLPEPLVLYRRHLHQQVGPRKRNQAPGGLTALITGQARSAADRANANTYAAALRTAMIVRDRLTATSSEFDSSKARAELSALIKHLEARANLNESVWLRLPSVLRELFSFRYSRFSNGTASALKDLIKGNSPGSSV